MLEEQWVPLSGYPNYEVSNYGRVTNVNTGRDISPYPDKRTGILRVAIYRNGSRKDVQLKRLVAKCYFLNYQDDSKVNHRNNNKADCSVLNLTLSMSDPLERDAQYLASLQDGEKIRHLNATLDQLQMVINRAKEIRELNNS